jgi:hypothetical protein
MLLTFRSNLYTSLLQSYDYVMYLRHHYLNSNVGQVLGAMLFAWSSVIAALLFAYWVYTAFHLLAVQGEELTDADMAQLHWSRSRRMIGRQLARARRFNPRWFMAL